MLGRNGRRIGTTTRMFGFVARMARRVLVHGRRDDGLDECRHDRPRRLRVDRTVQADDAAEGGERIGIARADVGIGGVLCRSPRRTGSCA